MSNELFKSFDLSHAIEQRCFDSYPAQAGALGATLDNVLATVKARDLALFQEIMKFQMGVEDTLLTTEDQFKGM